MFVVYFVKLRVPVVLEDPSYEKKYHLSSWHVFLPTDVSHGQYYEFI